MIVVIFHVALQTTSTHAIQTYIDEQFEKYLLEELKKKRNILEFPDRRVHACIYFIEPTGHSLPSLDLVALRELQNKVWGSSLCGT